MNKAHEGEIDDPMIALGNERDELLEKLNHLLKQWHGAKNVDPKQWDDATDVDPKPWDDATDVDLKLITLTVELQAEVENELEGAYTSLHAVEQKIAEISATTPEGLRVKLRLLAEICGSLVADTDVDGWLDLERVREGAGDEPSESFDDLTSRSLRENIGLAAQLVGSVSTDIEQLIALRRDLSEDQLRVVRELVARSFHGSAKRR